MSVRYLLLLVLSANGYYVQGAFFGSRLWEFALGMVLGFAYRRYPVEIEQRLFSFPILAAGRRELRPWTVQLCECRKRICSTMHSSVLDCL